MKKRSYILIILLIFFVLFSASIISFLYFEFSKPPAVKANSYLEINLKGALQEKSSGESITTLFLGGPSLTLYEIWTNIQKAKVDRRIKCLVLRLGYIQCDWGKISELREMILDFKLSGKKVYAYIDEALDFDKEYYLATACDRIVFYPLGTLIINGIGGHLPFVKKTLEILGIKAEFEHVEQYKTASSMFTEEGFTEAHKEMMESIYGDIFSTYIQETAKSRGMSEDELKEIIDNGYFQGELAKENGLVDDLLFEDEFEDLLAKEHDRIRKIRHEQYLKVRPTALGLNRGKKIALIYGMGPIHTGESTALTIGSTTLARWIKRARTDRSIAAIILRVDSPGGSAIASDIIWREVSLAKKEKPFVVSMSDVAGSGGYWISMAAHKIVAQPQTLTGSIGVVGGKFNLENLYEKLGITSERLTYGKRADMFSTFRGLTLEERSLFKKEMLWIYDKFLEKVALGRKMTKEEVDNLGKGRVWTGFQAKEKGLVDEIGGLSKALELAKELSGIPSSEEVKFVVWPKKVSLWSALMGRRAVQVNLNISPRAEKIINTFKLIERDRIWAIMPLGITFD
jgi:protease-4